MLTEKDALQSLPATRNYKPPERVLLFVEDLLLENPRKIKVQDMLCAIDRFYTVTADEKIVFRLLLSPRTQLIEVQYGEGWVQENSFPSTIVHDPFLISDRFHTVHKLKTLIDIIHPQTPIENLVIRWGPRTFWVDVDSETGI